MERWYKMNLKEICVRCELDSPHDRGQFTRMSMIVSVRTLLQSGGFFASCTTVSFPRILHLFLSSGGSSDNYKYYATRDQSADGELQPAELRDFMGINWRYGEK
jgi:hypothetical protein